MAGDHADAAARVWVRPELVRIGALSHVAQYDPSKHPHGGPPGQTGCRPNQLCS
ncbi:MAG: hypothetical protein R3D89_05245 [Sphingomonadaceae bacterium]